MPEHVKASPIPKRKPRTPPNHRLVDENMINFAKEHEGPIPYLYKDTENKITTGIGFNVDSQPKKAYDLGLYWAEGRNLTSRRASIKDIEEAYKRIKPLPAGKYVEFYNPTESGNKKLLNIRMREQDMKKIVEKKLLQSEQELKRKIPSFDIIPYPARKALLDMQYNMGDVQFSPQKWKALYEAIDLRDWKKAAKQSNRMNVNGARNQSIYNLFMEADAYY